VISFGFRWSNRLTSKKTKFSLLEVWAKIVFYFACLLKLEWRGGGILLYVFWYDMNVGLE